MFCLKNKSSFFLQFANYFFLESAVDKCDPVFLSNWHKSIQGPLGESFTYRSFFSHVHNQEKQKLEELLSNERQRQTQAKAISRHQPNLCIYIYTYNIYIYVHVYV